MKDQHLEVEESIVQTLKWKIECTKTKVYL